MPNDRMRTRVERLEAARPAVVGRWHRVIARGSETDEQAIDVYGREQIGATDHVVLRRIVSARTSGIPEARQPC